MTVLMYLSNACDPWQTMVKIGSTFSSYFEILRGIPRETHQKLSNDTHIVLNWFRINSIIANPGKIQIMFLKSFINDGNITCIIENKHIKSTNEVKFWELPLTTNLLLENT